MLLTSPPPFPSFPDAMPLCHSATLPLCHSPGRPGDCSPGLPQIRTCGFPASGSCRHGFTFPLRYPWGFRGPVSGDQRPRRVSPPRLHDGPSPSLPGVPAVQVPPLPRYYGKVRLPASLSPRFVSFAWRYQALRLSFRSRRSRAPNRGPGVHHPVPRPGQYAWRRPGPPRFLGNPCVPMPCSQTPAGPPLPGRFGRAARPPHMATARAPTRRQFRGSIAEPRYWLSTLRRVSCLTATQDSLLDAGQAFPGGIVDPQGSDERFP